MDAKSPMVHFVKATANVFQDMLGLAITGGEPEDEGDFFKSYGLTVIVGFTGGWRGRFFLDMSQETAIKMAGMLTGEEYQSAAEEEVLLSGAEVGNIISGHAITVINNAIPGLNIRLTPPSVFAGDDLSMFNVRLSSWSVVMKTDIGQIKINVASEARKG